MRRGDVVTVAVTENLVSLDLPLSSRLMPCPPSTPQSSYVR